MEVPLRGDNHTVSQVISSRRDLLDLLNPKLHPVTIGALLARLSCRCVLRMRKTGIVERILLSNPFLYAIPGGVHQVIMGCTITLQCNPGWCLLEIDFANAHSDCGRGNIWEELKRNSYFHYLIKICMCLYCDSVTP